MSASNTRSRAAHTLLAAALSDTTQNNMLRPDPTVITFRSAKGQVESKGAELDATTKPIDGLNLIAADSHLDTLADDDAGQLDERFAGLHAQVDAIDLFDKFVISCRSDYRYRGESGDVIGSLV